MSYELLTFPSGLDSFQNNHPSSHSGHWYVVPDNNERLKDNG
jgi:hypothetical protein